LLLSFLLYWPQWKGDKRLFLLERFVPLKRLKEIDEACCKPLSACLEALYGNQCDLDQRHFYPCVPQVNFEVNVLPALFLRDHEVSVHGLAGKATDIGWL